MSNEILFFVHCGVVLTFLLVAIYLGRDAVVAYIAASWAYANFFVTKQVMLFGFEVTASDAYAIGGMLSLSILQELWGRQYAMKAIYASFLLLGLASAVSVVHLAYIPSAHDVMHDHFAALLTATPRLALASFVTFIISSRLEIALFAKLSQMPGLPFPLRAAISTAIVMLVDTLLFSLLGLYGIVADLFDIIVISYLLKLLTIAIMSPFLACGKRIKAIGETYTFAKT
jgi:uncharacterized integral membrane protein (TIGR00697 family)